MTPAEGAAPVRWSLFHIAMVLASCGALASAGSPSPGFRVAAGEIGGRSLVLSGDARPFLIAPLFSLLDHMTLLTLPQHAAMLMTAIIVGGWLAARRQRSTGVVLIANGTMRNSDYRLGTSTIARGRLPAIGMGAVAGAAILLSLCLWGAMARRPMLHLTGARADDIVVDFHAHSDASWDARAGWSRARLREWLDGAGFDAAYVTDHGVLWPHGWATREAEEERTSRAASSGTEAACCGVRLLPGIEVRGFGAHLNLLGVTDDDRALFRERGAILDGTAWSRDTTRDRKRLVAVLTAPFARQARAVSGAVQAVEVVDGAPKGLDFSHRERAMVDRLAARRVLATVSGSDQHGWGRTAAAWTILHVPGWRAMPLTELDRAIRAQLRGGRPGNVLVVERTLLPGTGTAWGTMFTAPLLLYSTVRGAPLRERAALLLWVWAALVVAPRALAAWRARLDAAPRDRARLGRGPVRQAA